MRTGRLRRILSKKLDISRSRDAFINEFSQLESSEHAQTLGATVNLGEMAKNPAEFKLDPIYKVNPIKEQLNEITGRVLKDNNYQYHTPLYKDLLTAVVPLRREFRMTKDIEARKQMAKTEFDAWNNYQTLRSQDVNVKKTEDEVLNEDWKDSKTHFDHDIKPHEMRLLKEFFDRFKVSTFLFLVHLFYYLGPSHPQSQQHQAHRVPRRVQQDLQVPSTNPPKELGSVNTSILRVLGQHGWFGSYF